MNRKERKHTNFGSENEEDKPKIGAVHCAQMCRKYTPNGEMGHPKWQNGIPQMRFWGMINGDSGHREKGAEVEFWVSRAEKWGV